MKLSYEDKKKIIKLRSDGLTIKAIAMEINLNVDTVKWIIKLHSLHGDEALIKQKNKSYTASFKNNIIKEYLLGIPKKALAVKYNVSKSLIISWIKDYELFGYNEIKTRKRGQPKVKQEDLSKPLADKERKEEIVKAIDELRHIYSLSELLSQAKMAKSTYFSIKNRLNDPIDKDKENKQIIIETYNNHKHRYGYRRVYQDLRNKGYNISESKVRKLMKLLQLKVYCPKVKYQSFKGEVGQTCKNLLLEKEIDEINHKTKYTRNFKTTGPNQKWTTDVSEFRIPAGKVYLSPILDMNNGEIISYNISTSPNFKQTMDMLNAALNKFDDLTGLIFHSDQGWQYRMEEFQQTLESNGILQSMSRKGNCYGNSPMENFFEIIKKEMFYGHEYEFKSVEHLINEIHKYINYYNNIRIKSNLNGLSPSQYRQHSLYVI